MVASPGDLLSTRRLMTVGVLCLSVAAVAYGALHMSSRRAALVHVTWAAGVDDAMRQMAEQRYSLSLGEQEGERTWGYTLTDVSDENLRALVTNGVVEATPDIDRASFRVVPSAPRRADPTLPTWVPLGLSVVSVLGLFIGVASIGLGFAARAGVKTPAGQFDRSLIRKHLLATTQVTSILLAIVTIGLCFVAARSMELRVDEQENQAQIERYIAGNYVTITGTAGGFHALAAAAARVTGLSTKEDIRLFVVLISGATILLFGFLVRRVEPSASTMRTLQFTFFPLLFPFWFLIYSDGLGLLLLLLAIIALTRRRFHSAGTLMLVSVAVRQTYIVWAALLGLWTVILNIGEPWGVLAKRCASFAITAGLFVLFVIVNGGVAVGDRDNHPDMAFHTENVLFMLVCFFVMFLPLIVSKLPEITRLPRAVLFGVPAASAVLFFGTFRVDHSGNTQWQDYYLRNAMLEAMTSSPVAGAAASVAIALAVLALCVIRLRQPAHYLIYPFTALSLTPVWLVEQRYYLPTFALFMLFRESGSPRVERTLLAIYVVLALYLFAGVVDGALFL